MKDFDFDLMIPHRSPALIVRSIESRRDESFTVCGMIEPEHPSVFNGMAPGILAMEFAAQGAGLFLAVLRTNEDPEALRPKTGYLASLREVRLEMQALPVNCPLIAEVTIEGQFASMASFIATVKVGEDIAATGRLAVSG